MSTNSLETNRKAVAKIFLDYGARDIGGTSIFVKKFGKELSRRQVKVTNNINDQFDFVLVVSTMPLIKIIKAKRRQVKVIQRLDGVYFPRVRGPLYPLWNLKMKLIHNYLADAIIYQGHYGKYSCNTYLGKTKVPFFIIPNGVDTNIFTPAGAVADLREHSRQTVLITVGAFRRTDMILPILQACEQLAKSGRDIKLVVVGTVSQNLQQEIVKYQSAKFVSFVGKVPNEKLPVFLRSSDMFLFSDSSVCPNAVLEALASGLPVVGFDRGGLNELVDKSCGVLVPHDNDEFQRLKTFNIEAMAQGIAAVTENLASYKLGARKHAENNFSLEAMTSRYISAFQSVS